MSARPILVASGTATGVIPEKGPAIGHDLFHNPTDVRCTISPNRRRVDRCIRNGVKRSSIPDGAKWRTRGRAARWSPRTDATPRPFSSTTARSCRGTASHSKGCTWSSGRFGIRSSSGNTVATRIGRLKRSVRCIRCRDDRRCPTLARAESETKKKPESSVGLCVGESHRPMFTSMLTGYYLLCRSLNDKYWHQSKISASA